MATHPSHSAGTKTRRPNNLSDAGGDIERAFGTLVTGTNETAVAVSDVVNIFGNALDQSLRKQPHATVGLAVAMGFFLGAIWKA
jgi:hypothetical protein